MTLRTNLLGVMVAVVVSAPITPARADDPTPPPATPSAGADTDNDQFILEGEVTIGGSGEVPADAQPVTDGPAPYSYELVLGEDECGEDGVQCGGTVSCGDGGTLALQYENDGGGAPIDGTGDAVCLGGEPGEPAEVTAWMVLQAFYRIPLPDSVLVLDPKNKTLVNLDTIFSTEATPQFVTSVMLLGQRVTLDIQPSQYTWDHGDGTMAVTDSPGMAWRRGVDVDSGRYLTHVYEHDGSVRPRVNTTWSARYRIGGGPWLLVPGTVTVEGRPANLDVLEAPPELHGPD